MAGIAHHHGFRRRAARSKGAVHIAENRRELFGVVQLALRVGYDAVFTAHAERETDIALGVLDVINQRGRIGIGGKGRLLFARVGSKNRHFRAELFKQIPDKHGGGALRAVHRYFEGFKHGVIGGFEKIGAVFLQQAAVGFHNASRLLAAERRVAVDAG